MVIELKNKNNLLNSIDIKAFINIIFIMLLGILLLTSAGSAVAEKLGLSHYYFVKKQLLFLLIGVAIILFLSSLSEKSIRRVIFIGFIGTVILLIAVIFFGDSTKGLKGGLIFLVFLYNHLNF